MVIFRSEYLFAFDLVSSAMHRYIPDWKPVSLLSRTASEKSNFTANMRHVIQRLLEVDNIHGPGQEASILFDDWFKRKFINLDNCEEFTKYVTVEFCLMGYTHSRFLGSCALIAEFSALAYIYGVIGAPQFAIFCVTHMLCYFRSKSQFKESSWSELDRFAHRVLNPTRLIC